MTPLCHSEVLSVCKYTTFNFNGHQTILSYMVRTIVLCSFYTLNTFYKGHL